VCWPGTEDRDTLGGPLSTPLFAPSFLLCYSCFFVDDTNFFSTQERNIKMANGTGAQIGQVVQIIGPVVDVEFKDYLPPVYQALRITSEGFNVDTAIDVVAEVQQHLGEGRVRAVSMLPTDGMVRGMKVIDLGGPIMVPVGKRDPWPRDECDRRSGGRAGPAERGRKTIHSPSRADV
jgi:hypothetical protein